MDDITAESKGIGKQFESTKFHQASGPAGLNARVIKECKFEIAPVQACIYSGLIAHGLISAA